VSNTPVHDRCLQDHIFEWFKPGPDFTPAPRPTRFDAELVVAGIEGAATVRAGLDPITGGLR